MRKEFKSVLPSSRTLSKWYSHEDAELGITKKAFNTLTLACKNETSPIYCALMMDEIALRKHVEFNGNKYYGYVDFGSEIHSDSVERQLNV